MLTARFSALQYVIKLPFWSTSWNSAIVIAEEYCLSSLKLTIPKGEVPVPPAKAVTNCVGTVKLSLIKVFNSFTVPYVLVS